MPFSAWWSARTPLQRYAFWVVSLAYLLTLFVTVLVSGWGTYIAGPRGSSFFDSANVTAFALSMWANILFFTAVGLATLLISLKRPEHDILENRVWYLFSSRNATNAARQYIVERIHKFAAFASRGSITYAVREYNPDIQAYKVEVTNLLYLKNMLPYEQYVDKDVELEVWCDKIENPPGGELGAVMMARIIKDDSPIELVPKVVPIRVTDPNPFFKDAYELTMGPSGSATYEYKYWVWALVTEGIVSQFNRYSENITVKLENDLPDRTLTYEVAGEGVATGVRQLAKGSTVTLKADLTLTPETSVSVTLFAP